MSQPKFAPITASLLARKGSAMPSMMEPSAAPSFVYAPPKRPDVLPPIDYAKPIVSPPLPPAAKSHHEPDPAHPKKLFVTLSQHEHERLAIAAVKTGLTRHQLVRDALDLYFAKLSLDVCKNCTCVSGSPCSEFG